MRAAAGLPARCTCWALAVCVSAVYAQGSASGIALPPDATPRAVLGWAAAVTAVVPVNSSLTLHRALERAATTDVVALLQEDIALDGPIWSGSPVIIPAGRIAVVRSMLKAAPNVTQFDAIRSAGGKTLNFSQQAGVLRVEAGAALVLDSVFVTGIPSAAEYQERQGLEPWPFGLALYPSVLFSSGSQSGNNVTEIRYLSSDCSPAALQNVAFRGGIALGDPSAAGVVQGGDAVYLQGASVFSFPIVDSTRGNATVGSILVISNTTVRRCYLDPYLMASAADSDTGEGKGVPAWAWVLVALGAVGIMLGGAVAAALLHRRRAGARRAAAAQCEASAGDSTQSVAWTSVQGDKDTSPTITDMRTDADALVQLRDAWRTRIGQVHGLEFLEAVGRGGFGTVYRGRWKGATVGVKLVEHSLSGALSRQIQREAALAASVSHPCVVLTYKVCTVGLADLEKLPHYVEVSGVGRAPGAEADAAPPGGRGAWEVELGSRRGSSSERSGTAAAAAKPSGGSAASAPQQPARHSGEGSGGKPATTPGDLVATLIVMEYCDLGSVHEALYSHAYRLPGGGPNAVAIVRTLIDCAMGLDYLHTAAGIVHGDLKPANVLLKSAGNTRRGWAAKLGDFGVARMLDSRQSARPSLIAGTHSYTAPETMATGQLTHASDAYSFGILMWELWSEAQPFKGVPPGQLGYRVDVLQERPPLDPGMPRAYAALMAKCWAGQSSERPSIEQVLAELRKQLSALVQAAPHAEESNQRFLQLLREAAQPRLK